MGAAAETGQAPQGKPHKSAAFFIVLTTLIISVFTGLVAWGTQSIIGGNEKPDEGNVTDGVRVFNISVKEWDFEPSVIKVYPGDRVRFVISSKDVWHGFAINELNVNLTIPSEKTVSQEVTIPTDAADRVFTSYCSVFCGLGHPYLKGKVIVGQPKLFLGIGLGKTLPYLATIVIAGIFTAVILVSRKRAGKKS